MPAVAVARASAAEGSTQDSSSRSASFESEGGTPRTPATVWSVWSSGPLARHFLREWAKEFAASFKGRSSVTAIVSKAILKLSDDGAAPEAPVEPMVAASASAFLRSRHGRALTALQQVAAEAPRAEHFSAPLIVARGGYGAVFRARHRSSDRVYAIKRQPLSQLVPGGTADKRAWIEHRVLTSLRSRFLLDATFAFTDGRETWLATRYMDGGDLSHYLRHRRGLGAAARFYLASVILGVEALHAARICYRDLKAKNVLLDMRGQALALGLARTRMLTLAPALALAPAAAAAAAAVPAPAPAPAAAPAAAPARGLAPTRRGSPTSG